VQGVAAGQVGDGGPHGVASILQRRVGCGALGTDDHIGPTRGYEVADARAQAGHLGTVWLFGVGAHLLGDRARWHVVGLRLKAGRRAGNEAIDLRVGRQFDAHVDAAIGRDLVATIQNGTGREPSLPQVRLA